MLVRRDAFEKVHGFDESFRNCLEDADLCLRLGESGHEVRYCPDSVVYHLESSSRGRRSDEIEAAGRLFRERWDDKAERDDLRVYLEDGLLRIRYRDLHPLRIEVAPELAVAAGEDLGAFIEAQAGQLADLLRETVRLTADAADIELETTQTEPPPAHAAALGSLVSDAERLQLEIGAFQASVAGALTEAGGPNGKPAFAVGDRLSHLAMRERVRAVVDALVPPGAGVLVVSRGDDRLLELGDRGAAHFLQEEDGTYAGRHPASSGEAIEQLERLRAGGAEYLVIPEPDAWWLDHYEEFARHIGSRYQSLTQSGASCRVFRLTERAGE